MGQMEKKTDNDMKTYIYRSFFIVMRGLKIRMRFRCVFFLKLPKEYAMLLDFLRSRVPDLQRGAKTLNPKP